MYAEECIHGKLHKLKFKITKIVPNEKIEYSPTYCFIWKFFPKNECLIGQKDESCLLTASGTYRVGKIGEIFFGKSIERALSSVKQQ